MYVCLPVCSIREKFTHQISNKLPPKNTGWSERLPPLPTVTFEWLKINDEAAGRIKTLNMSTNISPLSQKLEFGG